MIVYRRRTLYVTTFAEKYPNPFVVIAHFDPREQIDEEGTGQPSYFSVLSGAQTGPGLTWRMYWHRQHADSDDQIVICAG